MKKKIHITNLMLCLLGVFASQSFFAQTTIIIQPDSLAGKNAGLRENFPNANYGSSTEIISFDWTFSGVEARGYSLFQFDLSSIPLNTSIISATLSLYHNPTSGSAGQAGNNACYLKKVTSNWDKNLVTWNTIPTATNIDQVLLATSTSTTQDYTNIDITDFVTDWHSAPLSNHGMLLELIDQSLYNSMKFCSSSCLDSNLRPKLEVTHTKVNYVPDNEESNIKLYLFPNPTSDFITIDLGENSSELFSIDILNSTGQLIQRRSKLKSNTQIDVSTYSKGIYFVKVYSDIFISTKKIIIE